jgi:hypothetical protein
MLTNLSSKSNERWNSYLFDYGYDGESWSFEISARTEREAKERVEQLANATYLGENKFTVPGQFGPLARLICAVRNFFATPR